MCFFMILQIVALREQNAHLQRKVASGEGGDDLLEGSEAQQKIHGKVSISIFKDPAFTHWGKNASQLNWSYLKYLKIHKN